MLTAAAAARDLVRDKNGVGVDASKSGDEQKRAYEYCCCCCHSLLLLSEQYSNNPKIDGLVGALLLLLLQCVD